MAGSNPCVFANKAELVLGNCKLRDGVVVKGVGGSSIGDPEQHSIVGLVRVENCCLIGFQSREVSGDVDEGAGLGCRHDHQGV